MKNERFSRPSNRDIVRTAFAAGVPREEIPLKYGLTETQVREAIKRVRSLGETTYSPLPSAPPELRRRLSEERKGKAPEKAIKAVSTVWPIVGPLSDRGFIPSEIANLTGLTRQQVYNALHEKRRKNNVSSRYNDPEVIEERNRRYHKRSQDVRRNLVEVPEEYDQKILQLARQIVTLKLLRDISDWDEMEEILEQRDREPRTRACAIIFECTFRAGKLQNKSRKRKIFYERISQAAQEVMYRAEDYFDLSLIRLEATRRSRVHV